MSMVTSCVSEGAEIQTQLGAGLLRPTFSLPRTSPPRRSFLGPSTSSSAQTPRGSTQRKAGVPHSAESLASRTSSPTLSRLSGLLAIPSTRQAPTSGSLHFPSPLPGTRYTGPGKPSGYSLTAIGLLLKGHCIPATLLQIVDVLCPWTPLGSSPQHLPSVQGGLVPRHQEQPWPLPPHLHWPPFPGKPWVGNGGRNRLHQQLHAWPSGPNLKCPHKPSTQGAATGWQLGFLQPTTACRHKPTHEAPPTPVLPLQSPPPQFSKEECV